MEVTKEWAQLMVDTNIGGHLSLLTMHYPQAADKLMPLLIDMVMDMAGLEKYKDDPDNKTFILDVEEHIWALFNQYRWTLTERFLVEGMPTKSGIIIATAGSDLNN